MFSLSARAVLVMLAAGLLLLATSGACSKNKPGFVGYQVSSTPSRAVMVLYDPYGSPAVVRRVVAGKIVSTVSIAKCPGESSAVQSVNVVADGWGVVLYGTTTKMRGDLWGHSGHRVAISCYIDFRTGEAVAAGLRLPGIGHLQAETKYASDLRLASNGTGTVVAAWWTHGRGRTIEILGPSGVTTVSLEKLQLDSCDPETISDREVKFLCWSVTAVPQLWRVVVSLRTNAIRPVKHGPLFSFPSGSTIGVVSVAPGGRFAAVTVTTGAPKVGNPYGARSTVSVLDITRKRVVRSHAASARVDALELSAGGEHLLLGHQNAVRVTDATGEGTYHSRVVYLRGGNAAAVELLVDHPMQHMWWEVPGKSFWYVGNIRTHRERIPHAAASTHM